MSSKGSTICIIIIVILIIFVTNGATYLIVSNTQNNDNNKEIIDKDDTIDKDEDKNNDEEKLIDGVKLINAIKQNDKIIENFEIIINGKKNNLELNFLYNNEDNIEKVLGYFKDYEIYLNDKENANNDEIFNVNVIKEEFTENNFKFINGLDGKKYLLIIGKSSGLFPDRLYVLNDKLELISKDIPSIEVCLGNAFTIQSGYTYHELENNVSPWYQDSLNVCNSKENCNVVLKLEDNKIYYLAPVIDNYNFESANTVLEERVYTINNDVLNYSVINKYRIVNGSGNIC